MTDNTKYNYPLDNYGVLTEPMPDNAPHYNFKLIRDYCKKNNKTLATMTESEIEQFRNN